MAGVIAARGGRITDMREKKLAKPGDGLDRV